jgi:hypothetical protein
LSWRWKESRSFCAQYGVAGLRKERRARQHCSCCRWTAIASCPLLSACVQAFTCSSYLVPRSAAFTLRRRQSAAVVSSARSSTCRGSVGLAGQSRQGIESGANQDNGNHSLLYDTAERRVVTSLIKVLRPYSWRGRLVGARTARSPAEPKRSLSPPRNDVPLIARACLPSDM